MAELIQANWVLLVIAVIIGLIVAWWIFVANRKTSVELESKEDGAQTAKRNQALIDAPPAVARHATVQPKPAATPEVAPVAATPAPAPAPTPAPAPAPAPAAAKADDLTRIKGLGPKLNSQLAEMGITSFAQIAAWDDAEIDRVDAQMGRFQGRIRRDDWVTQARLLAAGDLVAYESQFGRN
ncbi:hypothetical protein GCM10009127_14220 [Alteraurantiacibacter aestuarii]|uniref:Uncharacterized protein n=1 Tax=Alteraurantiacibacter aestuarii TaxID=650004 RepID=A0A844ZLR7_9SPHN|nr:hypothetical protein [Alteraurantiacibacter aestuarii]MXO87990.1 hypothetical protein [Alteraurantiacibacter aestuarii]